MLKVFLSHSVITEDYALITHLANTFWQGGAEVFIPEWLPRYPEDIRKVNKTTKIQIDYSDILLGVTTVKCSRASWMQQELAYGLDTGKKVVLLAEDGANIEPLTVALGGVPIVRFSRRDFSATAQNVLSAFENQLTQGTTEVFTNLLLLGLGIWTLSHLSQMRS